MLKYNVKFWYDFENDLYKFLAYMKNYFLNLYSDTWIIDEIKIINLHNESLEELYLLIKNKILKIAEFWLLWYKPKWEFKDYKLCENTFYLKSYRFDFISKMYDKEKTILIENIKITKK
jgi:hypothetical protein